jgi:membrane-associated phospholipid phosphatase
MKLAKALVSQLAFATAGSVSVPVVSVPIDAEVRKPFAWHLARALTKQIYAVYLAVSVLLCLFPALLPALYAGGTHLPNWLLLLQLTCYEVVLVDVLCKRFLRFPRPLPPHRNGFPSGHSTYSFAVAALVGTLFPALAPLWFAVAGAIAWSRFYLKAHFLYQVCGGAIMGLFLGLLVTSL